MKLFQRCVNLVTAVIVLFLGIPHSSVHGQTVLRVAVMGHEWQTIANEFTAIHPDIQIEVEIYPYGQYIDKITSMMAAGSPPDIFQVWAQYQAVWTDLGLIYDITSHVDASEKIRATNIYPFMLDSATRNGRIYGIPFDYNSTLWIYNRTAFSERGLAEPINDWTIDDHLELAKKLTDPQRRIYGTQNPIVGGTGHNIQWVHNWAGHGWISEDRTEVLVDKPGNMDMLQHWYDIEHIYRVAPTPGSFQPRGDLFTGGYAMWQGWLSYVFNSFPDPYPYDWGLALFPKGEFGQQSYAQGHMFSISSGTKHPTEAWTFLEWMGSQEGQKVIVRELNVEPIGPDGELWDIFYERLPAEKRDYVRAWMTEVLFGGDNVKNYTYESTFPEENRIMVEHLRNIFRYENAIPSEMGSAAARLRALLND